MSIEKQGEFRNLGLQKIDTCIRKIYNLSK